MFPKLTKHDRLGQRLNKKWSASWSRVTSLRLLAAHLNTETLNEHVEEKKKKTEAKESSSSVIATRRGGKPKTGIEVILFTFSS